MDSGVNFKREGKQPRSKADFRVAPDMLKLPPFPVVH